LHLTTIPEKAGASFLPIYVNRNKSYGSPGDRTRQVANSKKKRIETRARTGAEGVQNEILTWRNLAKKWKFGSKKTANGIQIRERRTAEYRAD